MSAVNAPPRIYHVAPLRYVWIWFTFAPLGLLFIGMGTFAPHSRESGGMILGGAMWLAVTLFVHFLVRFARLELSEKGVRLRQIGYRLEAPWSDVSEIWVDRGHECFVTSRPVSGKGGKLLAAAGHGVNGTFVGMSFYTAEMQALLDEGRLIPIEAFARYLRHGKLRADLEHFAPHLRGQIARLDDPAPAHAPVAPRVRPPRPKATFRQWATFVVIMLGLLGLIVFATTSKAHEQIVYRICGFLFPASLAVSIGIGARNCFRIGSWLAGTGMALVATLLALWAFSEASTLANLLGSGGAFMQIFVTLLFTLLAFGTGSGARWASRHRYRVLVAVLLLLGIFLTLCAIFSALELTKLH